MKLLVRGFAFILAAGLLFSVKTYASGLEGFAPESLYELDLAPLTSVIDKRLPEGAPDFSELFGNAVSGRLPLSPDEIISTALDMLFADTSEFLGILRTMIIVSLLAAVFKIMSSSFSQRAVVEAGFYVNFLIVATLLISSVVSGVSLMQGFVEDLCLIVEAMLPLIVSLMTASGRTDGAFAFAPAVFQIIGFISAGIRDIYAPCLITGAMLGVCNWVYEKELMTKLLELIRSALSMALKLSAGLFVGILGLLGLSAPIMANALTGSAKYAVGTVPVIGSALKNAVDAVTAWASVLKSGFAAAAAVFIIIVSAAPLIKLAAALLAYRLTAAVIQPISEDRLVKAIDWTANFAALTLAAAALAAFMMVFTVILMLSV